MNRLQKKCFLASAGMHGLLLCVILFGSAFFVREDKVDQSFHQITVYNIKDVTDGPTMGGGPNIPQAAAQTPPAQPQVPQQPQVKPQPQPKPEPAKVEPPKRLETPKVAQNKKEKIQDKELQPVKKLSNNKVSDFSLNTKKKNVLDDSSLKPITRKNTRKTAKQQEKDNSDDEAEAQYRAEVARRRAAAKEFASAFRSLSSGISSSTPVEMPGTGAGAFAAVNYDDLLASKYYNAWTAPTDVSEGTPTVQVSITVARDGSVISAHIIRRSGVSAMDRSIQNVLEAVKYIEAFPEGAKDQQRTFKITFNLEAKRQLG
jgi:colicin import membrane protein